MKKTMVNGRIIPKKMQANIYGGLVVPVSCTANCTCADGCKVKATIEVCTSCSATDQVGVTCNDTGVTVKCSTPCQDHGGFGQA